MIINFATRAGFATPLPAAQFAVAATLPVAPPPAPTPPPPALPALTITQIVTSGNVAVLVSDSVIVINKAASANTTISLPPVNLFTGQMLVVADWNGNAALMTFTPSGGNLIDNMATWPQTSTPSAPFFAILLPINTGGIAGWLAV